MSHRGDETTRNLLVSTKWDVGWRDFESQFPIVLFRLGFRSVKVVHGVVSVFVRSQSPTEKYPYEGGGWGAVSFDRPVSLHYSPTGFLSFPP